MATEKKVLTNLTPNIKGSFQRLNQQMTFCNGYEKPRYFDRSARAGYLGLEELTTAPRVGSASGGSLTAGLYYSAVFVPVDTRYADKNGNYRRGNPSPASTAYLTDSTYKTILFVMDAEHSQKNFVEYSGARVFSFPYITDNASAFKATWADSIFNFTYQGTSYSITASTSSATMSAIASDIQSKARIATGSNITCTWNQVLTTSGYFEMESDSTESTNTLTINNGGVSSRMFPYTANFTYGLQIAPYLAPEANEIWVYCSQGSPTATLAEEGAKYYVGKFANRAKSQLYGSPPATVTDMKVFVLTTDPTTANDALELDNYQPPTFRHTCVMQDRLFGVVGVTEARGKVTWDSANLRFQGKTYGTFNINTYTSLGNNLFRIAFSGSPDLSAITTSMRVTLSGCASTLNSVTLVPILAVDNTAKTIDIRNETGVQDLAPSGTGIIYTTFIADGFVGAKFRFDADGVNQLYEIATVDWANQRFTTTANYGGIKTAGTYYDFFIETADRILWWSKVDDPNSFPSENTLQFEEDLTAVAPAGEYLAVFSRNHIYSVNPRASEEGFRQTQAPIGTLSPFSCVPTETGLFFFDGKTIRQFDGLQAPDATRRKVRVFLEGLNETMLDMVHGVYLPNEQSIRWYVPYGTTAVTNNFYVQYNVNTGFWWIGQSIDCSCATVLTDKTTGELDLYTGTSARYADIGQILKHGGVETDGIDATTTAVFGTIDSITDASNTMSFTVGTGLVLSTNDVGVPFNVFSATGTRSITGIFKTIVDNGGGTYTVTYHDDFDLSSVSAGDWIAIGVPTFRWGIKWLDFGTPQYKHELKELHLHFTPADYIYGIVDFYTDFNDTPNRSVAFNITTGETKAVVRYHGERGYQVGFKIRAWSADELEIRDIVVIHRSIV